MRVSIGAPPQNEACFSFKLGLGCERVILTTGTRHDQDWNPGSHGCELSAAIELSRYSIQPTEWGEGFTQKVLDCGIYIQTLIR